MDPTNRTPAGDQYSLGCTLYFCLTGRVPFPEGSAVEKMMAHQSKEPPAITEFAPDCPDGLVQVVARLMAKKPEDRYSGMDEVVEAMEPYLGELAAAAAAKPAGTGSVHRMAGLSANGRPTGGSQVRSGFSMPVQTPTPAQPRAGVPGRSNYGQSTPVAQPTGRSSFGQPNPLAQPSASGARNLPGRMSFQPPPPPDTFGDEVPLVSAEPTRAAVSDQARMSAGWTSGTPAERKKPAFGMAGMIAAALTVAALVFLAVKVLYLDKQ